MSEPANATQTPGIAPPSAPGGENRLKQVAPIGAAALAIVVAVVGGTVLTERKDIAEAPAEFAPADGPGPISGPIDVGAAPEAPPPVSSAPAETAPGPDLQPGDPGPGLAIPGVAQNQIPGAVANAGIEIVVKFKNDAVVKDIIDTFWKDAAAARKKFDAFKTKNALFAGTRLDRVTYSNELVIVSDGVAAPAKRLAAMRAIAAKLSTAPEISYAEPNLVAHPGVK